MPLNLVSVSEMASLFVAPALGPASGGPPFDSDKTSSTVFSWWVVSGVGDASDCDRRATRAIALAVRPRISLPRWSRSQRCQDWETVADAPDGAVVGGYTGDKAVRARMRRNEQVVLRYGVSDHVHHRVA